MAASCAELAGEGFTQLLVLGLQFAVAGPESVELLA